MRKYLNDRPTTKLPLRSTTSCLFCLENIKSNETSRLIAHVKRCNKIELELKDEVLSEIHSNSKQFVNEEDLNVRLSQIIVRNNLPLRLVKCEMFKKLIKDICPDWRLVTREKISSQIIPQASKTIQKEFQSLLRSKEDYVLSLEFDHWTDLRKKSLLGVVSSYTDGSRYLFSLEDVSLVGHSTSAIVDALKKIIERLPQSKINASISDSASACKAAREQLVQELDGHYLQHRCFPHFLNRMGDSYTSQSSISVILDWSTKIVSYVNNNRRLSDRLAADGRKKMVKAVSVRGTLISTC